MFSATWMAGKRNPDDVHKQKTVNASVEAGVVRISGRSVDPRSDNRRSTVLKDCSLTFNRR